MRSILSHTSVAIMGMVVKRAAEQPAEKPATPPRYLKLMGETIPVELRNPVDDKLEGYARENLRIQAAQNVPMCVTKTLALCGAGPSLRRAEKIVQCADEVWACNSALPWMISQGWPVDVGIGMDQTPALLKEWSDPPDVTYYVASTCDPELVRHLLAHKRRVRFFHNAVGFDGEIEHYQTWPPSYIVGHGSTVVSRAVGLAGWMGFHRVDMCGVDCAFEGDEVHANGDNATEAYGNPVLMHCEIDGKRWVVRPDMLMDAVDIVRLAKDKRGLIRFQGGTLPAALLDKDEEFLDSVSRRLAPGEFPPEPGA
jgi:hypothetical protein